MKVVFPFLVYLLGACTGTQPPITKSAPLHGRGVLERDLRWIQDSIPVLRFATPYVYGTWRLAAEACSGKTRDGWPTFYVAPIAPLTARRAAFFAPSSQSIVFGLGYENNAPFVIHEILHWLTQDDIPKAPPHETEDEFVVRSHPAEIFGPDGRCAHLLYPKAE